MILVTGADHSHGASLLQFLESVTVHAPDQRVVVYDLGLLAEQRSACERIPAVELRTFEFANYPDYVDIRVNAGEYAWKPTIIWSVLERSSEIVAWLDAGCVLTSSLVELERAVLTHGFYSPWSAGTVAAWTHPRMLAYFGLGSGWGQDRRNLNAAAVAFDPFRPAARILARDWAAHALIKECIAPEGSDRSNHRQDQALLTVLAHLQGLAASGEHRYLGFIPHQDVEDAQAERSGKDSARKHLAKAFAGSSNYARRAQEVSKRFLRFARASRQLGTYTRLASHQALEAYIANSAGKTRVKLTMGERAAAQTPQLLAALAGHLHATKPTETTSQGFAELVGSGDAQALAAHFSAYASDKASEHDYEHVYASILRDLGEEVSNLLEVGLGSNNPDVVSNMGRDGVPGASLRAWRAYLPTAFIFGADVDRRILFTEDRITTFFVDQTNFSSVKALADVLPDGLDLVIDDGLHSPDANLAILLLGLSKIRPGGWIVIEDIRPAAAPLWIAVAGLFRPDYYATYLVTTRGGTRMFCVKRSANRSAR